MRFLLIPIGSYGDVHPFIGLGAVLKKRGHLIRMITNGYFEPLARKAGFEFDELASADDYIRLSSNPDLWHPTKAFPLVAKHGILPALRPTYDLIKKYFIPGETVVAAGSLAMGARIAQDHLGVPTATIHLQPAIFRSVYDPPLLPGAEFMRKLPVFARRWMFRLMDVVVDGILAKGINQFRSELGIKPVHRIFDQWTHSPELTIGLFPEWFCAPQKDWPASARLTGFPLYDGADQEPMTDDLKKFLKDGPSPVVFTGGSAMRLGHGFFKAAVDACRALNRRGVLLAKYKEQIPADLPDYVRHFSYAPFSEIFPKAAAAVHHGGIGTTAQALAAGVPQLITPLSHDQLDNAARVERMGAGKSISPRDFLREKGITLLRNLLENEVVKKNTTEISHRFSDPQGLKTTADLLEALRSKT